MGKKIATKIIHTGSSPEKNSGSINIPVYKNSTLIFNNYNTFLNAKKSRFNLPYYGRINTKTTSNLAKIISTLYKSKFTVLTSSGLSAITLTLKTFLKKNDEVLITENCYEPVFNFAQSELSKFGVKVTYFSNNCKNLENLIKENTKLIYAESPGSLNFEVSDLKKISSLAKKNKIISIIDNTWSTFLGCNPLIYGFDIVIESATKYISGHSDNFLGIVTTKSKLMYESIKKTTVRYGDFVSSESCYSAFNGLRTLKIRIENHSKNASEIFDFLKSKNIVININYLPDKGNKNYELWKKYYSLSNGLITFSIIKKGLVEKFIDNLEIFKIGFSWGGYESLILPLNNLKPTKKLTTNNKYWFRIHVGLEDVSDLKKDLEKAMDIYEAQ